MGIAWTDVAKSTVVEVFAIAFAGRPLQLDGVFEQGKNALLVKPDIDERSNVPLLYIKVSVRSSPLVWLAESFAN